MSSGPLAGSQRADTARDVRESRSQSMHTIQLRPLARPYKFRTIDCDLKSACTVSDLVMSVTGRSMTVFGRRMACIDFLKYIATGRP